MQKTEDLCSPFDELQDLLLREWRFDTVEKAAS